MRLTIVSGRPVHYHAPLFRRLADDPALEVEVLYASSAGASPAYDPGFEEEIVWERDLLSGYRSRILEEEGGDGGCKPDYRALYRAVRESRPDVVWTSEYARPHTWVALPAARGVGAGTVFRGEADLKPDRSWPVRAAKRIVLPPFYAAFDAVLYSYEANRRYCRHYGVPEEKLFFCPSAVDGDWLREQAEGADRSAFLREQFSLDPGRSIVLFVGKLMEVKRPLDLVRAFAQAGLEGESALVFVGAGEREEDMRREARSLGIGRALHVTGFVPQEKVAQWYRAADLVALPSSSDRSPKVLHEAMEFGLPVVVSEGVGTVDDFVREGVNGCVHPVGDVEALAGCLADLVRSDELRERLGAGARETAEEWSMERAAEGVRRAAWHAAEKRGARPEAAAPSAVDQGDR